MDILKALILGIIEGLTEFLPISSTAHLILSERAFRFADAASVFTVVIQLGAILAAIWYFKNDLDYIVKQLIAKDKQMIGFTKNVAIGVLPASVMGLVIEKTVGLPDSLWLIAGALIVGGLVFLWVESRVTKKPAIGGEVMYGDITTKRSLIIGISQAISIIPGVSRSGATIMSGLLVGLDRKTATVFSFYLSIPIMMAASGLKLIDDHSALSKISGGPPALIVGAIGAFATSCIVISWLLKYVTTNDFKPFAYYRIALGIVILVSLLLV